MQIDRDQIRDYLKRFDFENLFNELGWDYHEQRLQFSIDGKNYILSAIAEKRKLVVYGCQPDSEGKIPNHATRRKIDREVTKRTREHLIIYTDAAQTEQRWQWVRQEIGKPIASREQPFYKHQAGDALIQKLEAIAFSLDEEEELTSAEVQGRTRKAFDVERITKKFYEQFKKEHAEFLKFIQGIQSIADKEWYASLMFNRLMFIYFIQTKRFLNSDPDYLQNKLQKCQEERGQDEFYSFYRYFLLRLFHDGLGKQERSSELEKLLGKVPYLNGGLFELHQLERDNPEIQIPDAAFEKVFKFLGEWDWHLDDRPLKQGNEINPDVLGYIFEKYINQKQMGAYYTKEDITEYISKNCIIPFLFEAAEKACAIAFKPNSALWKLLQDNPDRYIYPAVRTGVDMPLPVEIVAGVSDVSKRDGWNRPAAKEFALPTETWREHVARRQRCLDLRHKLATGEIHSVNDLITYNLDIRQFAQDAIENCEGPELLRAFYKAIEQVSILDPTCGSGAFLFAALNILEPLYDACLERMQLFLDDLARSGQKHRPEKFSDFRTCLERVAKHPNRRYFILKSIILNNLYGVDIMEEATEICKLRLFLKLVAQVEPNLGKPNSGLEPLPDIDFNIRAGNTLVGFANYEEVRKAVEGEDQKKLDLFSDMTRIDESAEIADRAFQKFREMQTEYGMDAAEFTEAKAQLRRRLETLNQELNSYLAREYGVDSRKSSTFEKWRVSHQPFHWFVEFYSLIKRGGFDVIIGNPPYVEISKIRSTYNTLGFSTVLCGNLYALCIERCMVMLKNRASLGLVVQQPLVSTQRMQAARDILLRDSSVILCSTYDDRPSKLFDGINHARIAILIAQKADLVGNTDLYVTSYNKWYKEERSVLFQCLSYTKSLEHLIIRCFPKIHLSVESGIIQKMFTTPARFEELIFNRETKHRIYYKITGVGHWFTVTMRPPEFLRQGAESSSTREQFICFSDSATRNCAFAILNSSLFYWFYQVRTNCRDFNPSDYKTFPICSSFGVEDFSNLSTHLQQSLDSSSAFINVKHSQTGAIQLEQFKPRESKPIIDKIDRILAQHYGFADEELDFIINYDIKYRMGRDAEGEE